MAAPEPESSASTSSTDAPAVMSASACVCIVLALPCALSILNWVEPSPAASNAFFRYGASNVTYRAEVVVSGRRTPTMPLPCAASEVSCFIAEKSAVNASAEICGTAPPEPVGLAVGDVLGPEQAASAVVVRAATKV